MLGGLFYLYDLGTRKQLETYMLCFNTVVELIHNTTQ
jgi:hypothetical protein